MAIREDDPAMVPDSALAHTMPPGRTVRGNSQAAKGMRAAANVFSAKSPVAKGRSASPQDSNVFKAKWDGIDRD